MPFWKRKPHWDEVTDEYYGERTRERKHSDRIRVLPHFCAIALLGALFLGAVGVVGGKTMFEKTLTALVQPCGLIWLLLILLIYFCLLCRQGWPAFIGLLCFLILSIAGNSYVANWVALQREAPFVDIDPMSMEPLDTVFVLGGGTLTRTDGVPQLSWNGDRIATAAKLFHAGKIQNIICTGTQTFRTTEKDLHPREEAASILADLKVPVERIGQMKGENTFQEVQNIKKWMDANPDAKRVGILTSAWHLKRAMRLAKAEGIEGIEPIPANFMNLPFAPTPNLLIPSATNLEITRTMLKEYLGGLVGR